MGMVIKNVSFIVIARNESFAIEKCLASIASMPLTECEVICVDSDSTDNTLNVMKGYIGRIENLTIVQCSGYVNASVGRNAGLKYATKKYIFFVDGDVELYPDFLAEALDRIELGKADAVTGILEQIVYCDDYKKIEKPFSYRKYYPRVMDISHCGGIFLVTRQLAEMVGTWDELMDINEDFDFTLRLHRYGKFLALPSTMGRHHTLSYDERPWLYFKKRFPMYFGMVIRKNLTQPKAILSLHRLLRGYMFGFIMYLLLLAGIPLAFALPGSFCYVAFIISLLVASDLGWGAIKKKSVLNRCLLHYLHVPLIIAGILFDANHNRPPKVVRRIC